MPVEVFQGKSGDIFILTVDESVIRYKLFKCKNCTPNIQTGTLGLHGKLDDEHLMAAAPLCVELPHPTPHNHVIRLFCLAPWAEGGLAREGAIDQSTRTTPGTHTGLADIRTMRAGKNRVSDILLHSVVAIDFL
ncbi:hypothetical protein RRG08_059455 [Elysia crispata]|uniref:Uncharacterized protein n=1 Tax=Elysia crispata TaxID=231223 RepID=A0AAE1DRY0_9GAST|nr:hypothetical protein RRG08_059455 [Elysia crispata]